ncbi:SDR family NAD(P)-dependent oxidoreductase [Pseudomonas sp. N040]|uniref:SDR family NAD(P)-dependent oxidoreductase n=1 Tax=Pseudomonas sp. N040 TaxID=2785325 RepID=UPI0018A31C3E|nr:SDR family oxidoreductase [Pseudomonas sp. N040]MBF7729100.1 SDR family oxidoreductase [Pseudomonas sp. N040]MBW7012740.1 SDR family oxidoreductase [Pseudomonas sp. N040]
MSNALATLNGKTVLVTGAASGIGLECAKAYARQGARIVLTDINAAALEIARAEISALGVPCLALLCNVGDSASISACAAAVSQEWGALDVLVNNAGIFYLGGFMETDAAIWQRMFQINVLGVVEMTRAFLPAMRAASGARRIVNIASLGGFLPAPNISAYAMSKHAVVGLSEALAMELTGSNVGVTVVCPGVINTPLLGGRNAGANITERQLQMQADYYRTHGCHPSEVASAVVKATQQGIAYCYTGPKAKLGIYAVRFSRRLARWFSIRGARDNGYLDPGA